MSILTIARQVRKWAEDQNWKSSDLMGMCGIAAAELWRQLKKNGIESTICVWDEDFSGHCFVVVDETETLVDVTATQFGKPKVVVKKYRQCKGSFWDVTYTFSDPKELVTYQKAAHWPTSQTARV